MPQKPLHLALKIWDNFSGKSVSISIEEQLQLEVEVYKKLLHFFQIGDFYYYIFNVTNAEFDFVSPSITNVLGYQPSEVTLMFLFNKIHPDDQKYYVNFENEVGKFLHSVPKEKMFNYKVRMNFRIQKSNGIYIPIIYQVMAIQQDEYGKITRSLGVHTDISTLNVILTPTLSFIGLNGEPSYTNVQIGEQLIPINEPLLSKREKEILLFMMEGKQNHEIANILNLSKQTVETHRKNMLRKAGAKSSSELVALAIRMGWV